jgi:hypothetical protein
MFPGDLEPAQNRSITLNGELWLNAVDAGGGRQRLDLKCRRTIREGHRPCFPKREDGTGE